MIISQIIHRFTYVYELCALLLAPLSDEYKGFGLDIWLQIQCFWIFVLYETIFVFCCNMFYDLLNERYEGGLKSPSKLRKTGLVRTKVI